MSFEYEIADDNDEHGRIRVVDVVGWLETLQVDKTVETSPRKDGQWTMEYEKKNKNMRSHNRSIYEFIHTQN